MLNISKEDIKSLNDSDLRELIGMLCEAELYANIKDTYGVSYGGNQDEKDDGIDVKVNIVKESEICGFIPKKNTIFQVKKPMMTPAKIKKEMTNIDGSIKKCIETLSENNGAYIIASSGDDLTEVTYNSRISAMKEILDASGITNITVKFYDSNRIAIWTRKYPSLVCWVNDKNKKNTNGWTSYCNWSNRRTKEQEFIINEESTLYYNDFNKDNKLKLIDGINQMRLNLIVPQNAVRLAGLSGVGKTRLAQALFDNTIGENALNKTMVIYGDVSDNLFPDPITFIQQLENLNKQIILIVDNCEAKMHNKLTELCQRENGKISLMTIEYEVKEDDNIDSNNYYLTSTSDEVLKKLIKRDFEQISDINIDTIVKCSDGNFRIAIYLAKSINTRKNIGVLKDNELFERLFYQGNTVDNDLLKIGTVCSLFYSFDVTYDSDNEKNELNIISSLISEEPLKVFGNIDELRKRQIVQSRGNMRAVLPHALANRLAIEFLRKYPEDKLIKVIERNERLCISFFRRLKFLHTSDEAQNIVNKYLMNIDDEKFINANDNLLEKIKCITILNPEIILERIEGIQDELFFSRQNKKFYEWVRILGYIAFDKKFFVRAINLIIRFALTEKIGENYNSIRHILNSFFHIYLSFTHAPLDMRLEVINELLTNNDETKMNLGLKLIDEVLDYGSFIGVPIFDCGSQIRDYGLEPEPREWYERTIEYCGEQLNKGICYEELKEIIANNFKNLSSIGFYNQLEKLVEENILKGSWPRIWISLLSIKRFDSKKVPCDLMQRMDLLLEKVKPITISDKVKIFLDKGKRIYINIDDTTENEKEINNIIYNLGKDIAIEKERIKENLLLLDDSCSSYRIGFFAKGLYENYDEKENLIYIILNLIYEKNENIMKELVSSLIGIYHDENKILCSELLDNLICDERYNKNYIDFQLAYTLEDEDLIRIEKAIDLGIVKYINLSNLDWYLREMNTEKIIKLLEKLPKDNNFNNRNLFTLYRLVKERPEDALLKQYIRKNIVNLDYDKIKDSNDHHENYIISESIKVSFDKDNGIEEAMEIYKKLNLLTEKDFIYFYPYKDIVVPLIKVYPIEFLNVFIDYIGKPNFGKREFFKRVYNLNDNILKYIDDDKIIEWVEANKKVLEISYLIEPYVFDDKAGYYVWSKLGEYIIDNYYEDEIIMKNIISQVYPNSWDEKYSSVLKKRENLFLTLKKNSNPIISDIGKRKHTEILKQIDICIINEKKEAEKEFNTFE